MSFNSSLQKGLYADVVYSRVLDLSYSPANIDALFFTTERNKGIFYLYEVYYMLYSFTTLGSFSQLRMGTTIGGTEVHGSVTFTFANIGEFLTTGITVEAVAANTAVYVGQRSTSTGNVNLKINCIAKGYYAL